MQIVKIKIDDLTPYSNNAKKHTAEQIEQIKSSITKFGNNDPIAVSGSDNVIVEGHGRYMALKELGREEALCIRLDHLTEDERKAYAIAHNKMTMNTGFDLDLLKLEMESLLDVDFDLELTGFEDNEIADLFDSIIEEDSTGYVLDKNRETLQERFVVPPFSVLDTRQGYWQERKRVWKGIIKSGAGRDDGLIGDGLKKLAEKTGSNLTGTSIFDPVLCETLINWFCPRGGKVIDPFAGGSVRGLISVLMGNEYTGIDLSKKQIEANYENFNEISGRKDFEGNELRSPNWINDDSMNIDKIVDEKHDFMLTCPPYADLEVYSNDPKDLSNMPYDDFISAYREILKKTAGKLKDNAFAAIVVGDVRDKKGYYYNFVGDTIQAAKDAGMQYYNECILVEQIATGAMRAGKQFEARRKVVKTHQNVLVFIKGNEKEVMNRLNAYEYNFAEVEADVESA